MCLFKISINYTFLYFPTKQPTNNGVLPHSKQFPKLFKIATITSLKKELQAKVQNPQTNQTVDGGLFTKSCKLKLASISITFYQKSIKIMGESSKNLEKSIFGEIKF